MSHRGTSWLEAAGPGAASGEVPLGRRRTEAPEGRRKPSKGRGEPGRPAIVRSPGVAGWTLPFPGRWGGTHGDRPSPLKRAGWDTVPRELRGGGQYHPPPGKGGWGEPGLRSPPAGLGRWKRREPALGGYWGAPACSIPSGGVCVFGGSLLFLLGGRRVCGGGIVWGVPGDRRGAGGS